MEFEQLIRLIQTVSDSELSGFKYEENGVCLELAKEKELVQVPVVTTVQKELSAAELAAAGASVAGMPVAGMSVAGTAAAESAAAKQESEQENEQKAGTLMNSPLVGTFYAAPAEDAAPFVSVGDTVKKGQVLAIVEAMKLMNEIESECEGVVLEVLAENGQPVEYGQPLFRIG
jgi:acetyl-CoA carboxylase biotin carboxyl carrier protein